MKNSYHGFTLIEMMIGLAILAIIISIGEPSFNQIVKNARTASIASCLSSALYTARSEAVKRGASVTVCPYGNTDSCGEDWNKGALVFSEGAMTPPSTDLAKAEVDSDSTVLRLCPLASEAVTISAKGSTDRTASNISARKFIRYSRDGSANWSLGYFTICDDRSSENWKALNVGLSGDIRVARLNTAGTALLDAFNRSISSC